MRLLENSVGEYADRLVSIERAYQLGIAHNIARIYADILNEPLPAEIARLVAHLDPGQEARQPARKDGKQLAGSPAPSLPDEVPACRELSSTSGRSHRCW